MSDLHRLTAIGFDLGEIHRVLHNFACRRVLATYCTGITNHHDLILEPWITTRVEIGENITKAAFDQLVRSEESAVVARFCHVAETNYDKPNKILAWLAAVNKARRAYARTYQQALDEVRRINHDAGRILSWGLAAAAVAQCAGELALIGAAAFPIGAVGCCIDTAAMTLRTAVGKVAISVFATTAIGIADHWNANTKTDMVVAVAQDDAKSAGQSLPGTAADTIEATFQRITNRIFHNTVMRVRQARPNLSHNHFWREARAAAAQNVKRARGGAGVVTKLGYICAAWSAWDSSAKLWNRLYDNKRYLFESSSE